MTGGSVRRRAPAVECRSFVSHETLKSTPLTASHRALGGRMVAFGGYDMPVQYPPGVLKEHLWAREHVGAFDVSHMGPAFLRLNRLSGDAEADHQAVAALVEPLICGDIRRLKPGQIRYTLLLNADGGVRDDLMIGRPTLSEQQGSLYIVVNAGTKEADFAVLAAAAGEQATLTRADDGALIALQGPEATTVLEGVVPGVASLAFMTYRVGDFQGCGITVARCGYTGDDGFEILAPAAVGAAMWERLLADARVRPVGLGARDSLRLEAGLPLYGHDLDETLSPFEASLDFAVSKRRLKAGDIPGTARLNREAAGGLTRVRVGLRVLEGAPAREGAVIADADGASVGVVTSGGFSPTLSAPVAMGYLPPALAPPGTRLAVIVRGKAQAAQVVALPFVPHRYFRQPAAS